MGPKAPYAPNQAGGLGLMVSSLLQTNGRLEETDIYLATPHIAGPQPDIKHLRTVYGTQEGFIELIDFHGTHHYDNAYGGNDADRKQTLREFQSGAAHVMIELEERYAHNLAVHSNDQFAGGMLNAEATRRGIPNLHTTHNQHTILLDHEDGPIDTQATALRNATLWNTVSKRWLEELLAGTHDLSSTQQAAIDEKHAQKDARYVHLVY